MFSVKKSQPILSVLAGALIVSGALSSIASAADKFPNGPVQLVVPWKPGGGTDRSARTFAPYLAKALGVPVNIVNISGGGGWVAWAQMAKWDAKKDDHKIGYVNIPHVFAYLDPKMKRKENINTFNFVSGATVDPCIWAVREGDERFQTLKQFIDYVVKNPNKVIMSTTAVGSDDHQGIAYAEKFIKGFKVKKVYANNDGKKIKEVLGNHTDAVAGNVGYYVKYMLEGKLRPLAVLDTQRSTYLPSVPTFFEVTGLKNISVAGRTLVVAPGLDQKKYQVIADAVKAALADANYAVKEIKSHNGLWPVSGDKLKATLTTTTERVKKVKYWEQTP
ncbi:MAG: tripartite tricarboxylate transporter substrate binding protein [Alphaproteobacteria bacterium]|nr:tripartite tricarboxylate transporter substrate binding protein [Alphaproteobacteria bacterium]